MKRRLLNTPTLLVLMALALALFYRGGGLPLALVGLLIFGTLTLIRPGLGLAFVPLTAPLYLIPATIQGVRASAFLVPLHEVVLLIVLGATLAGWLWRVSVVHGQTTNDQRPTTNDQRQADQRPPITDQRPPINDQRPTTDHRPTTTDHQRQGDKQTRGQGESKTEQSAIYNLQSAISQSNGLRTTDYALRYAPHALFLLAGALGVLLAVERGAALREFRWLIVEPLLFYALITYFARTHSCQLSVVSGQLQSTTDDRRPTTDEGQPAHPLTRSPAHPLTRSPERRTTDNGQRTIVSSCHLVIAAFILGGALAGLVGLLQFAGIDLAPLLGVKQCFAPSGQPCDNVVIIDGVRRATSVYGHPNNLGLYLGRVWPLAAALAAAPLLGRARDKERRTASGAYNASSLFFALCALLCLGGIVVSFSRGAWLGAVAALAVLAPGVIKEGRSRTKSGFLSSRFVLRLWSAKWLIVPGIALLVVGGLALALRGDLTGGSTSTRALIWREAIGYIRLHPLGLGLDQFLYYHDPRYGRSLIDPSLLDSSEVYAAHPHNFVLDAWLRVGPLGLLAFGWLLAHFVRAALPAVRAPSYAPLALGALAALAAALVHGMVDNFYFVPDLAFAFWLLFALVEAESY